MLVVSLLCCDDFRVEDVRVCVLDVMGSRNEDWDDKPGGGSGDAGLLGGLIGEGLMGRGFFC